MTKGRLAALYMQATIAGAPDPGVVDRDITLPPGFGQGGQIVLEEPPSCADVLAGEAPKQGEPQTLPFEEITIDTEDGRTITLNIEVARTPEQHGIGLMYREDIPEGTGMLFVNLDPDPDKGVEVWMEHTYEDLDIVFLDQDGRIVKIHTGAEACDVNNIIKGGPDAVHFLELPPDSVDSYGLKEGDIVNLPDDVKPRAPAPKIASFSTHLNYAL